LAAHLKRVLGVDLTTIPGLNLLAVLNLLSEIGTNITKWRNEKAFVSWLGLSPNNKISGAADAKFPYTQSRQSRSNDFTASGVDL
jgi:Transposase IS116/IS110/IS902 family